MPDESTFVPGSSSVENLCRRRGDGSWEDVTSGRFASSCSSLAVLWTGGRQEAELAALA